MVLNFEVVFVESFAVLVILSPSRPILPSLFFPCQFVFNDDRASLVNTGTLKGDQVAVNEDNILFLFTHFLSPMKKGAEAPLGLELYNLNVPLLLSGLRVYLVRESNIRWLSFSDTFRSFLQVVEKLSLPHLTAELVVY
ncbi:hypothetical protein [Pseudomonas phage SRT6]|uniref:Uncharacterized protein n=1 Tax=Pseudomonas phage Henu5 TaxID=2499902 RepID=A0A410T873_9CAUD|nr:hypothetical protein QE327_gp006 [Pseudomonas phage Henu5]AXC34673.1 hypothetical protein [Pseudomonas phage SRT6]QAU05039.1 hypothetical protein Henu5_gp7 [Pseudomonas phage Henu5]